MQMTFERFVTEHHFTLRCFPADDARQKIIEEKSEIFPNQFLSEERDAFGNKCVYGKAEIPHNYFSVEVSGIAEVAGENPIQSSDGKESLFKYATKLTACGRRLSDFYEKITKKNDMPPVSLSGVTLRHGSVTARQSFTELSHFQIAEFFMDSISRVFCYEAGVTGVFTTAEEAFALTKGVCQDYAHILLALCRKAKIPCRYVAGMMIGEGASHAWVEVFENGEGLSLDPTNNRRTDDTYIVISRGRDAQDCSINQGVFRWSENVGAQRQEISVEVREMG